METDLLKDFICVAKNLNYRRAAEELFISQSALTRRIKTLENTLGIVVFERNTRSVSLTDEGRLLLDSAQNILAALDDLHYQINEVEREERGKVAVYYYETGNYPYVTALIRIMKERFPLIELDIMEVETETVRKGLIDGCVDAVMMLQPSISDIPGLEYQVIKKESPCILLPAGHSLADRKSIKIEQIRDETVFMFHRAKSPQLYDRLLKVWTDTGYQPHLKNVPDRQISILVAAGEGVLLCPSNEQNSIDTPPGTVRIPIEGKFTGFDRVLAWKSDNMNPALRLLRKAMQSASEHVN